jgi:ribulose-phosphate 3-epimerase
MAIIYPSLFASDQLTIEQAIKLFNPYCQGYHLDLMDNRFVNNISFDYAAIRNIAQTAKKQLWVHLMVENPSHFIGQMDHLNDGDLVTFHIESTIDPFEIINLIHEKKLHAGIALRPKTSIAEIFQCAHQVHHILLMSVEPGFSGQSFLQDSIDRLQTMDAFRQEHALPFKIAMDGGINAGNIRQLAANGVDMCAVGAAIFSRPDPLAAFQEIVQLITSN